MLADLMFRKNKYDDAIYHFEQLLEKKPNNYEALVQFVQLLRRAGRLYDCPKFFKLAEKSHTRARIEPGLHYVKGLYQRYCMSGGAGRMEVGVPDFRGTQSMRVHEVLCPGWACRVFTSGGGGGASIEPPKLGGGFGKRAQLTGTINQ